MIHLSACIRRNQPLADEAVRLWTSQVVLPDLTKQWVHCRGNVFLSLQGDCDIDRFLYTSPRLVLICHSDLLGSGDCGDFRQANRNPAAFLAERYLHLGDSFAGDLHGWFGIILYDSEEGVLKSWTDHFGIRRIVFKDTAESFGIASDLRLLNRFFPQQPEIDPVAILEYLQYACIPAPRTIYRHTQRLEPGHFLICGPKVATHTYWDMSYEEVPGRSVDEWAADTGKAIESAVALAARQAEESSRVGCFLSGGTDSSSVSGLVGRITGEPPRTFSIGFSDRRYNEIEFARIAADCFKADHHEYFVSPPDILDLLHRVYAAYDEPFGNSSIVPAYYCARAGAECGTTHMLAGDGGDELFGGNQRYASDRVFQRYFLLPGLVRRRVLEPLIHAAQTRFGIEALGLAGRYIRRANIPTPDRYFSYDFLSNIEPEELFVQPSSGCAGGSHPLAAARRHFQSARADSDLNRWLYLDLKITITDNDIRKVTVMTEMAGVVPRYPLLDPALAEFSGRIPSRLKVQGTKLRLLFKEAMRGILPREIIAKKKHGFGLPFSIWLGEHPKLRDFVFDTLGSSAARQRGCFRPDLLEWLWSKYESESRIFYGDVLWIFLMLELWHVSNRRSMYDHVPPLRSQ